MSLEGVDADLQSSCQVGAQHFPKRRHRSELLHSTVTLIQTTRLLQIKDRTSTYGNVINARLPLLDGLGQSKLRQVEQTHAASPPSQPLLTPPCHKPLANFIQTSDVSLKYLYGFVG